MSQADKSGGRDSAGSTGVTLLPSTSTTPPQELLAPPKLAQPSEPLPPPQRHLAGYSVPKDQIPDEDIDWGERNIMYHQYNYNIIYYSDTWKQYFVGNNIPYEIRFRFRVHQFRKLCNSTVSMSLSPSFHQQYTMSCRLMPRARKPKARKSHSPSKVYQATHMT